MAHSSLVEVHCQALSRSVVEDDLGDQAARLAIEPDERFPVKLTSRPGSLLPSRSMSSMSRTSKGRRLRLDWARTPSCMSSETMHNDAPIASKPHGVDQALFGKAVDRSLDALNGQRVGGRRRSRRPSRSRCGARPQGHHLLHDPNA